MANVIYLAPPCQEHERMWCEHDAPVDCECIDGPHPWIKYVVALRQPAQSDALREALRNIQIEAEREKGSWAHLKRVIALNCKAALEQNK